MIIGKLSGIQMHGRSYQGWKNIKTQYQKPIHIFFIQLLIRIFNKHISVSLRVFP